MLKSFGDIFKIPELKKRVLFTLGLLAVYRLGASIPTPGVDAHALSIFFQNQSRTLFGFLDMFSGGALNRMSIFAMGIMPYINASIIMSLLQTMVPYLEKLSKEGELGRQKINQYTRRFTLILGAIQSWGLTLYITRMPPPAPGLPIVPDPSVGFFLLTILTFVTGTMFVMWLGEQITERGIGNGISLMIFAGIVDQLPSAIRNIFQLLGVGGISLFKVLLLLALIAVITASVVWVQTAQRKIPVQYAKRMVGRKLYGGQMSFLPLRVDQSGVIAVIFAVSLLSVPMTVAQFWQDSAIAKKVMEWSMQGGALYNIFYAGLIIFFCYFYNAIAFNPNDLAENMKKWGGFVPGIRPGESTAKYIEWILVRITAGGALFVALIAVLPDYLRSQLDAPFFFGGTALLIVVGVALDTVGQIESHLIMRHYESFSKFGRLRGRWFNVR